MEKCSVFIKPNSERSIFATQDIDQNEFVIEFDSTGYYLDHPNKYTIEIAPNKHLMHPRGMYVNHSFEPNTVVTSMGLMAIKKILKGEEITFDYTKNESSITHPFTDKSTGRKVE